MLSTMIAVFVAVVHVCASSAAETTSGQSGFTYELRRVEYVASKAEDADSAAAASSKRRPLMRSDKSNEEVQLPASHEAEAEHPELEAFDGAAEDPNGDCGFAAWTSWSACTSQCNGRSFRTREALGLLAEYFALGDATSFDFSNRTADLTRPETEVKGPKELSFGKAAVRFTGNLHIQKAGRYNFSIGKGPSNRLKVGAAFLMTSHASSEAQSARAWLARGMHSVYLESLGEPVAFIYSGPDTDHRPSEVDASVLRHKIAGSDRCIGSSVEKRSCNSPGCPVDCVWGHWEAWTSCTKPCSGGTMSRSRKVAVQALFGGKACTPSTRTEQKACNTGPCPSLRDDPRRKEEQTEDQTQVV